MLIGDFFLTHHIQALKLKCAVAFSSTVCVSTQVIRDVDKIIVTSTVEQKLYICLNL